VQADFAQDKALLQAKLHEFYLTKLSQQEDEA